MPRRLFENRAARRDKAGPIGQNPAREMLMNDTDPSAPAGTPTLRTLAMPGDANAAGDIFGGWVMAQMDLAAGIAAAERARGRVVTAAVNEMAFRSPVRIGDTLSIHAHVESVRRTSMVLYIEAWAQRYLSEQTERVTFARFTMVALDGTGKPTAIPPEA
jgi:acyl-CoA thioesterase YciA